MTSTEKRLLSITKASKYLSISRATINRLVNQNKIPSLKIGYRRLFDIVELDNFVENLKSEQSIITSVEQ